MFQVQNRAIQTRFITLAALALFWLCSDPKKLSKSTETVFSCIDEKWWELHSKHCGYVSGVKRSHPDLIFNFACSRPVPVVSGTGKVIKIRSKHFSPALMWNDKNCTPNSAGMFRVQNRFIRAPLSTLLASSLFLWCMDLKKSSKFD